MNCMEALVNKCRVYFIILACHVRQCKVSTQCTDHNAINTGYGSNHKYSASN